MAEYEKRNEYVSAVLAQVRWKSAHYTIKSELLAHIEDQAEAYKKEGVPCEEAEERAILDMGSAAEVGGRLDASYRPKDVSAALIPLSALVLIGVACRILVYSSTTQEWLSYIFSLVLGGALFVLMYNVNIYKFVKYSEYAYAWILLLLVLAALFTSGVQINGAVVTYIEYTSCWLPVLFAFCVYNARGRGLPSLFSLGASVAVAALVLISLPCFVGVTELVAVCLFVLIAASIKGVFSDKKALPILICCVSVAAGATVAIMIRPSIIQRLAVLLNPQASPLEYGWFAISARETVQGAALIGPGIDTARTISAGFSNAGWRSGYAAGDHLLTVVLQRYGILPTAFIASVLLAFIGVGLNKSARLSSNLGKLVGSTVMLGFLIRALNYIAINLGLYSGSVMPLPFISAGSAANVINLTLAGLLLSLFRTDGLTPEASGAPLHLPRLKVKLEWEK